MTLSIQLIQVPEDEPVTQREYYVDKFPFTIGREYDCDLVLNNSDRLISRKHGTLRRADAGGIIFNDQSTNGSLINGEPVHQGEDVTLNDGDLITIAGYQLLLSITVPKEKETPEEPEKNKDLHFDKTTAGVGFDDLELECDIATNHEPYTDAEEFSASGSDFESDLLFDPFANGPEMRETDNDPAKASKDNGIEVMEPTHFDGTALNEKSSQPYGMLMESRGSWVDLVDRSTTEAAIDAAIDRLLELVDPTVLESEYKEFLGPFSRSPRRLWKIHKTQFSRKRGSGEYRRLFKAILAEEIKK